MTKLSEVYDSDTPVGEVLQSKFCYGLDASYSIQEYLFLVDFSNVQQAR